MQTLVGGYPCHSFVIVRQLLKPRWIDRAALAVRRPWGLADGVQGEPQPARFAVLRLTRIDQTEVAHHPGKRTVGRLSHTAQEVRCGR